MLLCGRVPAKRFEHPTECKFQLQPLKHIKLLWRPMVLGAAWQIYAVVFSLDQGVYQAKSFGMWVDVSEPENPRDPTQR